MGKIKSETKLHVGWFQTFAKLRCTSDFRILGNLLNFSQKWSKTKKKGFCELWFHPFKSPLNRQILGLSIDYLVQTFSSTSIIKMKLWISILALGIIFLTINIESTEAGKIIFRKKKKKMNIYKAHPGPYFKYFS